MLPTAERQQHLLGGMSLTSRNRRQGASSADCYNVALDFSRSGANPSGPWAYGISDRLGSDLILFSVFSTTLSQASDSSQMAWWSMDGAQAPIAALNPSKVDRHPEIFR